MKRKETKTSPVASKKGRRVSLGDLGSPSLSLEEQRKRAREWAENLAKTNASTSSKSRSTTPSKRIKTEEPETEVMPKSKKDKTPAKKAKKEPVQKSSDEDDDEEEEPVVVSVARKRPTSMKTTNAKNATSFSSPPPKKAESPLPRQKTPTLSSSSKSPASKQNTPIVFSSTKSHYENKPSTPKMAAAFPSEPARSPVPVESPVRLTATSSSNSSSCQSCDKVCSVTMALTAVPLGVIGYYDWKIAATTLVVVVVMGALRRILRLIMAGEESCAVAEEAE